jgi:hypothetical protein
LLEGAIAVVIVVAVAFASGLLDSGPKSRPETSQGQVALAAWSRSATPVVTALVRDQGVLIRQLSHADKTRLAIGSSAVQALRSDLAQARTMKPPPGPAGAPAPTAWTIAISQLAQAVTTIDANRPGPAGSATIQTHLTASVQALLSLSQAVQLGQANKPG